MNQIVVKRVFNKDAFIPGHPYAILTQTKTVYGLFSHYENETTLDFVRMQKAISGNEYVTIYTDLLITVNDIDSGDIKSIMPMTISDNSEDTLGNENLDRFEGDVDIQESVADVIQNTDTIYESYSEAETLDYPVIESEPGDSKPTDKLHEQIKSVETATSESEDEEIADDDFLYDGTEE